MNRPSPPPPPPPPRRRRSERLAASEEKSDDDFVAVEEPEPIVEEPIEDDNEETVEQPQPLQPQVPLQQELQLEAETAQQEPEPLPQPQLLQPVQQAQAPILHQQQQQQPIIAPMPIPNHNENEEEYETATLNIRSLRGERIRILVYPGMMQEDLAQSIAHAALTPAEGIKLMECWSGSESFINWSRIAVSLHMDLCAFLFFMFLTSPSYTHFRECFENEIIYLYHFQFYFVIVIYTKMTCFEYQDDHLEISIRKKYKRLLQQDYTVNYFCMSLLHPMLHTNSRQEGI